MLSPSTLANHHFTWFCRRCTLSCRCPQRSVCRGQINMQSLFIAVVSPLIWGTFCIAHWEFPHTMEWKLEANLSLLAPYFFGVTWHSQLPLDLHSAWDLACRLGWFPVAGKNQKKYSWQSKLIIFWITQEFSVISFHVVGALTSPSPSIYVGDLKL